MKKPKVQNSFVKKKKEEEKCERRLTAKANETVHVRSVKFDESFAKPMAFE